MNTPELTQDEIVKISGKMNFGRIWKELSELDLTKELENFPEIVDKEIPLYLTISDGVALFIKHNLPYEDLASHFIIQLLLNQSPPKLKFELIKILDEALDFYTKNSSPERQKELLKQCGIIP